MPLPAGTRIGPYQVVGPLGAGGMGEVYRARDTKLGRDVALKILPDAFAADPDRLMRFEREARTLASLNHSHIAQIHGLEESNGTRTLVMELVEGEDLSARIARGPIPIDEALPLGRQVAEALEAAHELGIIHRDLKPANIKVRPDGTLKVLDFGLAKALDPADAPGHADQANSPTITSPALTMRGVILGTAAYMAPEQAKGKPVDKRADIWAFGCVLYEMLTGRRAFNGDDTTDTIVAVVSKEPDWTQLPAGVPAAVVRLLRRCLAKDRHLRLPDIAMARIEIDDASSAAGEGPKPVVGAPRRTPLAWAAAGAAGLLIGVIGARGLYPTGAAGASPAAATRSYIGEVPRTGVGRDVAISRDGLHVVFVGISDGLFVRPVDRLDAMALAGTAGARSPFFSPDGRWIGYFDRDNALARIPAGGGQPEIVSRLSATQRGATWLDDDTIVFATNDPSTGLLRVAASGGDATTLTTPDGATEGDHLWPAVVAGRAAVIYTVAPLRGTGAPEVRLLDIETGQHHVLARGANDARYVSAGFLVHSVPTSTVSASLYVRALDLARPEAAGAPVKVVESIIAGANLNTNYDVAPDGTLVYTESLGMAGRGVTTLAWMDQAGVETPLSAPPRTYLYPRISPDGRRVALDVRDQESDIWIWDIAAATLTRLTTDRSPDRFPAWHPDSRTVLYTSERDDTASVYRQSVMGTGAPERLTRGPNAHAMNSVVPDGSAIIVRESAPQYDLVRVPLPGGGPGQPLVKTPFLEQNGEVSPDRRWFAYESNEAGPFHVYVRPYPDVDSGRWQISQEGGTEPSWSRDGKALFFRSNRHALMRVDVTAGAEWTASAPRRLFDLSPSPPPIGGAARSYDQAPDGRFIVIKGPGFLTPRLVLVSNWLQELRAGARAEGTTPRR